MPKKKTKNSAARIWVREGFESRLGFSYREIICIQFSRILINNLVDCNIDNNNYQIYLCRKNEIV